MTFDDIDRLIEEAKGAELSEYLKGRQLSGEGRQIYYAFFRQLAMSNLLPHGIFLEIGCLTGTVAAHVLDVSDYHNRLYIGLDHNEIPFSHPKFVHLLGDSVSDSVYESVKQISLAYGGIACVYQDSSHHYEPTVKEWDLYSPLVNKGGLWIADDLTPAFRRPEIEPKGMVEYWAERPCKTRLYEDLHHGSVMGMAIL